MHRYSITPRAVFILLLSGLFLFYKYILQNFPSVMAVPLMEAFHLHGLGLGMLSGVYFWTYLIVPLFVGVLLDRYGTRFLSAIAVLFCAFGTFLFAYADQLIWALVGRALIGIGVSFATIAYLKLASIWFPAKYYALLTSLLVTSAMVGAMCGQMPLAFLMGLIGWRTTLLILAVAGFILAVLLYTVVNDKKAPYLEMAQDSSDAISWADFLLILKNKNNWLLTAYSGLAFSPVVVFCGLWGNPFLQKVYAIDNMTASTLISMVFLGLAVGSPVFAMIERWVKRRTMFMCHWTLVSALSLIILIYVHPLSLGMVTCLLFLFGFSLGAFPLVFVIGKEINPLYLAGTAISLINASDAFLDAVTEPIVGVILDAFKVGHMQQGLMFSMTGYHIALSILPLFQLLGAYLITRVKISSTVE